MKIFEITSSGISSHEMLFDDKSSIFMLLCVVKIPLNSTKTFILSIFLQELSSSLCDRYSSFSALLFFSPFIRIFPSYFWFAFYILLIPYGSYLALPLLRTNYFLFLFHFILPKKSLNKLPQFIPNVLKDKFNSITSQLFYFNKRNLPLYCKKFLEDDMSLLLS